MGEDDTCELCFYVALNEEGNANDAMGDSVEFDIDITLKQNPSSGETVQATNSVGGQDEDNNGGSETATDDHDHDNGHGNDKGTDSSNPGNSNPPGQSK